MNDCTFMLQPIEVLPSLVIFVTEPMRVQPALVSPKAICHVVGSEEGIEEVRYGDVSPIFNPRRVMQYFDFGYDLKMELWLYRYFAGYISHEEAAARSSEVAEKVHKFVREAA